MMKYTKKLLLAFIFTGVLVPLSARAESEEWIFEKDGTSALDKLIDSLGDRLYCDSELCSGEHHNQIIDVHIKVLKNLLQKNNPPINHKDNLGRTPLMRAAFYNSWEAIELLLQAGADATLTENQELTALQVLLLCKSADPGSIMDITRVYIMPNYYTQERHNKCVELLTKKS